jgi:Fic family protein
MKMPVTPPVGAEQDVLTLASNKLGRILAAAVKTESEGKYRHWDIMRHLTPPGPFSSKHWWGATKLVREPALKDLALSDPNGRPFRYAVTDIIARRLHKIDLGAGGAIGMPEPIANPQTRNQYVMRSLFQEAVTSSQLEGAATTRAVAKEMIRSGRPPRTRGERMILNNYLTMQKIAEWKKRPLDQDLIFEIHRTVTEGTLDEPTAAGRFRRGDEPVAVQNDITGEVYYRPPPHEQLQQRVARLCNFANENISEVGRTRTRFVHPVIRAILLHFWLAYDHPFCDGNGRTARALFYWSMLRQEYWLFEFISISEILVRAPAKYALSFLHTETDGNDATYFLLYQTEVIRRAIDSLHEYIQTKSDELQTTENLLRGASQFNYRQHAIIGHALRHPGTHYTVEGHRRSHGVVYETARRDLLELAEAELLEMRRYGRAFTFTVPRNFVERAKRLAALKS